MTKGGGGGSAAPVGSAGSEAALQLRYADVLPFDRARDDERNELVAVIVHTADLSGQAYPRATSNNWSARIICEFRNQASKERSQGLPVAPFMAALDTPLQCARLQHSFVKNIVLPLWQRVAELLVNLSEPMENLNGSRLGFEFEETRAEKAEAEAKAAAAVAASAAAAAVAIVSTTRGAAVAAAAAPPIIAVAATPPAAAPGVTAPPPPHGPSALAKDASIIVASEEVAAAAGGGSA